MPDIRSAFDPLLAQAASDDERARLRDAARAAELLAAVDNPHDRRTVLTVLERLDALAELADALASSRIVRFPRERVRPPAEGPGGERPPEPFLVD